MIYGKIRKTAKDLAGFETGVFTILCKGGRVKKEGERAEKLERQRQSSVEKFQ
jgi:hypothetical protein